MKKQIYTLLALLMWSIFAMAQSAVDESLGRHDFFYAGQSKQMRMFIVKDGHVAWSYWNKEWRGEISDAILMTDGHILMAHQYGIAEVTQDNQVVWHYDAPEGTEIHTIQPIGRTHVVFVQNGHPAKAVVMEIPSKRIVREFELPVSEKGSVHGQFRNARLTSRGTLLVANMGLGMVIAVDAADAEKTNSNPARISKNIFIRHRPVLPMKHRRGYLFRRTVFLPRRWAAAAAHPERRY